MSIDDLTVLTHQNHPLYQSLRDQKIQVLHLDDFDQEKIGQCLIDLTNISREEKIDLYSGLQALIVADLSTQWGDMMFDQFPNLVGAVAASFWSPKKKIECFWRNDSSNNKLKNQCQELFSQLEIELIPSLAPGIGFVYPRTISMIINEAYFALEDQLAGPDDLDLAMKFGVNYPLGPIEWGEKIGLPLVVDLLDELFDVTGDNRYAASPLLRRESHKGI